MGRRCLLLDQADMRRSLLFIVKVLDYHLSICIYHTTFSSRGFSL